jgi:ferredoxin-NADP reductase
MVERGARPRVSRARRAVLHAARALTSPLLPDDYLELINPLWSTRELRGRVERIERQTDDAVTVLIKPGFAWEGHRPGQYLRVGLEIDGVHHWRAYSLTSEPHAPDGLISVTPKLYEPGTVSPFLVRRLRPGTIVRLGGVEGTFVLPDPPPRRLLFLTAGSGITPVVSMLRWLERRNALGDTVHVHSARTRDTVIFARELERLQADNRGYRLDLRLTADDGRLVPAEHLEEHCDDWREREVFACGPAELLDALTEHWEREGDRERLHMERFQPIIGGDAGEGEGGTIRFCRSGVEAEADGGTPILVAGEEAGAELPFGCRMGICHTCTGTLRSGRVRDLRTGELSGSEGEVVRTCVNAPEGPVEIDL